MFKLTRYFALASLAALVAAALALGYLYKRIAVQSLIAAAERHNVALTTAFANRTWPEFGPFLESLGAGTDAPAIAEHRETSRLAEFARETMRGTNVVKIKIYALDGRTIFSTERRQIGESKRDNAGFIGARDGKTVSELTHRDHFSAFEHTIVDRDLVSSYVPVYRSRSNEIVAVFELYDDLTDGVNAIDAKSRAVTGAVGGVFLVLYAVLFLIIVRAGQHIAVDEATSMQDAVRRSRAQLMTQQAAISALLRDERFQCGRLADSSRLVTEIAARIVGVERASIWQFTEDRGAIRCIDLFEATPARHSAGIELKVVDYPRYFHAVMTQQEIAADDAHHDPSTSEFAAGYLTPLGIGSMLDAPIMRGGAVDGVICLEHVGAATPWRSEQRMFAVSIASLAALLLEQESRARIEADLRAATLVSEAASRSKSAFLANMSHEIRTPMNGVLGMTELLLGTALDDTQRRFVETTHASAHALLRILSDILDLSKIEAGKLDMEHVSFDLGVTANQVSELHSAIARQKGIELRCEIAPEVALQVHGDPVRLRQVLSNLISNALKFTAEGEVVLKVARTGAEGLIQRVRFSVSDTGIGMSPQELRRVFEAFAQADQSTTRRYGGTGLGLTIARQLVRLMGGELTVASARDRGSIFEFELPMEIARATAQPLAAGREAGVIRADGHVAGGRVLLVEDNPVNREVALNVLARCGVAVDVAENGQVAVDKFARTLVGERYAAILMDCQMPVMDGFEATARIRSLEAAHGDHRDAPRTPIIALTANAMTGDRERCIAAGMDDHLAKPFRLRELQAVIGRWISADTAVR